MERSIAYNEEELKQLMERYIGSAMRALHREIKMMEEQGREERANLDWKSSAENLRRDHTSIVRAIEVLGFKVDDYEKYGG